jgi:hypothetical protein
MITSLATINHKAKFCTSGVAIAAAAAVLWFNLA